ncbi:conserved Plasmodium protein, unknown function [Plasmodium relictum]|uniref:Uncharacterized protein n=1 Tax=Plasmodium relictum TaxID=85471 RepID=A0A1J1H3J9_PLARL|nr:conserved Plasmodium protein, unknown function [Plasmodium relictum]CRG99128.1 conserved Plasmodium protein, unknown function [Plasmodium relictum]
MEKSYHIKNKEENNNKLDKYYTNEFQIYNNLENNSYHMPSSKMNTLKIKGLIKRKNKEFYDLITVISLNSEEIEEKIASKKENLKDNIALMKNMKDIMKNEKKMFKEIKTEKKITLKIKGNIKNISQKKNEIMKKYKEDSLNKYIHGYINDDNEYIDDIIGYLKKIKNIRFSGKVRKMKSKNVHSSRQEDINDSDYKKKKAENIKKVPKHYGIVSKNKIENKNGVEERIYKLLEENNPLNIKKKMIKKKKEKKAKKYDDSENKKKYVNYSPDELNELNENKKLMNNLRISEYMLIKLLKNDNIKINNANNFDEKLKKKISLKNKNSSLKTYLDLEKRKLHFNGLLKHIKISNKLIPSNNHSLKHFLLTKKQKEYNDKLYTQLSFYDNSLIKSNGKLQENSKNKSKGRKKVRKNSYKSYSLHSAKDHAMANDMNCTYNQTNLSSNSSDEENFTKTKIKNSKGYNEYFKIFPEFEKCKRKGIYNTNKRNQRGNDIRIIKSKSKKMFSRDKLKKKSVELYENLIVEEKNKKMSSFIYTGNLPNTKNASDLLTKNTLKYINEKSMKIKKKGINNRKLDKKSYQTNKLVRKTNLIKTISDKLNNNEEFTQKNTLNPHKVDIINLKEVNINVEKSLDKDTKKHPLDYSNKNEFTNILKTNSKKMINDKTKSTNQKPGLSSNELRLLFSKKNNYVSKNTIFKKETTVKIPFTIEKNEKECFSILNDEKCKSTYLNEKSTNLLKSKGETNSINKRIVNNEVNNKDHNIGNEILRIKTNSLSSNSDNIKNKYSSESNKNNIREILPNNSEDKNNNGSFINQKKIYQVLRKDDNLKENYASSNNFVGNNVGKTPKFSRKNESKESSLKQSMNIEQTNVKKNIFLNNENIKITLKEESLSKDKLIKSPIKSFQNSKFSLISSKNEVTKNTFSEKELENISTKELNNVDCNKDEILKKSVIHNIILDVNKNEITRKKDRDPSSNKREETETRPSTTSFEKNVIKNQYQKLQNIKKYINKENEAKQFSNVLASETCKEEINESNTNEYNNMHENTKLVINDLKKEISTLEKPAEGSNNISSNNNIKDEKKLIYSNNKILLKQRNLPIKKGINTYKYNNAESILLDENNILTANVKTNNEIKSNNLFKNVLNKNDKQLEKMNKDILLNKTIVPNLEVKKKICKEISLKSTLSNLKMEETKKGTINSKEIHRNKLEEQRRYINEDISSKNKIELNNQEQKGKINQMDEISIINKNTYSKNSLINVDKKEKVNSFSKNVSTIKSTLNEKNNNTVEDDNELENNLTKKDTTKNIKMEEISILEENENDLSSYLDSKYSNKFALQTFSKRIINNLSIKSEYDSKANILEKEKEMNIKTISKKMIIRPSNTDYKAVNEKQNPSVTPKSNIDIKMNQTESESTKKVFVMTNNFVSLKTVNKISESNKQKLEFKKLPDMSTTKLHSFESKIRLEKANLFDANNILISLGVKNVENNSKIKNKALILKNLSSKYSIKSVVKNVNKNEKEENDKPIMEIGSDKIMLKAKGFNIKNNQIKLSSKFLSNKTPIYIKNDDNYKKNKEGTEKEVNVKRGEESAGIRKDIEILNKEIKEENKEVKKENTDEIKEVKEEEEKKVKEEVKKEEIKVEEGKKKKEIKEEIKKEEKTKKEEIKEVKEEEETKKEEIKEVKEEETKKEEIKEVKEEETKKEEIKEVKEEETKKEEIKEVKEEEMKKEEIKEVKEEEMKKEEIKEVKEEETKKEEIKEVKKEETKKEEIKEVKEEETKKEEIKEVKEEETKKEEIKEVKEEETKKEEIKEVKEEETKKEEIKEVKEEETKKKEIKEENKEEKEDIKSVNPINKIRSTKIILKPKMYNAKSSEEKSSIKNISFIKKFHNIKNLSTLKQFPSKKSIGTENNETDKTVEDKLNTDESENISCTNSKSFSVNDKNEKNYHKVKFSKSINSNPINDENKNTESTIQSNLLLDEQNKNEKSDYTTNGTFLNSNSGNSSKFNSNNALKNPLEKKLLNFPKNSFNDSLKGTSSKETNDINNFSKDNPFLDKIEGNKPPVLKHEKSIPNTKEILKYLKNSKNALMPKGKNVPTFKKENNF